MAKDRILHYIPKPSLDSIGQYTLCGLEAIDWTMNKEDYCYDDEGDDMRWIGFTRPPIGGIRNVFCSKDALDEVVHDLNEYSDSRQRLCRSCVRRALVRIGKTEKDLVFRMMANE